MVMVMELHTDSGIADSSSSLDQSVGLKYVFPFYNGPTRNYYILVKLEIMY